MNIVINELSIEQINTALLRITRAIQSNTNNFQNDVQKAVANVTVNSKNTVQRYDDSYLMSLVTDLRDKYKNLNTITQDNILNIIKLETILANASLDYDENTNAITFNLGDYSTTFVLKDTTYDFSYDTETGDFKIVDNVTGETVFEETFNDTTYTFSFNNGVLTIHNNLTDVDQTFNFDARYYTEAEIQALILDKIPTQASSTNQLADKDFVNSSIATSTATFRGTVTNTTALAALTGDANDYAFLQNIDPVTGLTLSYDRYKWVESGGDYGHWKYEYTLNNSSFTSDQWAAINSGITCQIVQDLIDGCYSCESNIDVYCNTTCKCTINSANPLCLCANAFKANATISTTTYPGACCTGTLVQSDLNDYQKKNIPTAITINNTSNLTCIDTILSCFNSTIQKPAKRKTFSSAHCRYIYLANTAISSGSVSSSSYTLYLFATIYDSCPSKSYSIGTIQIDISSGSDANGFSIRGYTDIKLDCTTANYPRIVVTKDTTNNIYCLYLDTNYTYLSFDIQRNKSFGSNAWGDLCARASLSGTEIFNSSTSPNEIKYIGGLVSILNKVAANSDTPVALCTGETSVGKSGSCPLTFNTCCGILKTRCYCVDGHGYAKFALQNLTATNIGLTAGCCYPLTCILESLMACYGYQAGTYSFLYSNACNPIICETGGYAYCAVFTKEDHANPVANTWTMTRWRVTLNDGRSYCASAYSTANAGIACWNVQGSTAVSICRKAVSDDATCYLALLGGNSDNHAACIYVSNSCPLTFNPATGVLSAKCFVGAIDETKYPGACCVGSVTGGSFNGISGTVNNGLLSFSNINFDNICDSASKNVEANNITRRYLLTNQITNVGYRTRWGLGLERGTTGWGAGLLSLGIKDDGTCFADYKFTSSGGISLTCCGTAKGITLSGCATKNVFTCCLGSASNTRRYFQIKTKANRGSCSVSFDFDFFSMNGTINLDNGIGNQYYAGGYYGNLCVSVCSDTCACCDCFWLTYTGYRTLTLKSVYDFEVLCNTTTAPEDVTFCCFVRRPGSVTKIGVSDDASYNILLSNAANDTAMPSIGSNGKLTFNPSTGILDVSCGTCIGYYRTKSCCVKVTPTAQSSCWIYIGRYQTNGTADTTNTYNELNLTIAAIGYGMVSSANIKILSANAAAPTVIVQRQCGYSASTGIDCVAVTRSGSTWNCYVCVWARVVSSGTNNYYLHLYRNMLPDSWTTSLTVCSAITGDVVGVGNIGINQRAIQSNTPLRIGSLAACTSSVTGCAGSSYGAGFMEMYAGTPYIDFHVNNAEADCSSRILANTGVLCFVVNNSTGCTTVTERAVYNMCSNGLLYSPTGFAAGTNSNAACPFVYINCACGVRMIGLSRAPSADVGLMLSHCADWAGTTYCNLGIEVGSGNVNRGFYHCKAGTFEWLQYWDAACERHACPQCFACPIYGCSSATFAGCVSACNTQRWSTIYSSNTYNTGYYLIAEYKTNENGSGNHDITIGGCVDIAGSTACKTMRFKASIRGNKCTPSFYCAWVDSSMAADCLVFTRSVDTDTCTFALRIYGKINSYYTRFNTTIDYLAAGDVNVRKSNQYNCLTFPNTYAASTSDFCGTVIPINCNCGNLVATTYRTNATNITCSFAAGSTSYILLGCYAPSSTAGNANELDLGFALGGDSLVEKGSLKLLLTTGCCTASGFSNNNIEAKFSNYADSCYGVRKLIFTSGGSSWSCSIGIWLEVCNPGTAACSWSVDLLRNRIDSRFTASLTCAASISGTRVCTINVPAMRNFYFNNAEQNCFSNALTANALCSYIFNPLPTVICGNCNQCYIHLGCYRPTLMCANELDLTLTVGDSGNNSVNIKALLTTGCFNEFHKNNIRINTASLDRSHANIDSILFTTIGTSWNCPINIYALVCSTAACTCYTLYNNNKDVCFVRCFEALASLPPVPLICSFPITGDSVTTFSAPLLINTWKQETSASASFAINCNQYTTLVIGGVNDVRSPTYQKLLISTSITGSENPLNMWIDYMGGYGDKDFITACYSGANCNVIVPMRISSDSQNIYIDFATCVCAARDLCATIYSSCPMPLGSCGNAVRNTNYTACFITDYSCAYAYVMCQWPTTITLNVDDPASQFATRILSANTISAYCMATTSDVRQKKDIVPYNNGLCDISKLDIISFRYKNEDSSCIKHISIPANWTNPLLSGEKQNQLRVNDAVGILLSAVKDLTKSMTLSQKIKLWFYKKFIEPKNNKDIIQKVKRFN